MKMFYGFLIILSISIFNCESSTTASSKWFRLIIFQLFPKVYYNDVKKIIYFHKSQACSANGGIRKIFVFVLQISFE